MDFGNFVRPLCGINWYGSLRISYSQIHLRPIECLQQVTNDSERRARGAKSPFDLNLSELARLRGVSYLSIEILGRLAIGWSAEFIWLGSCARKVIPVPNPWRVTSSCKSIDPLCVYGTFAWSMYRHFKPNQVTRMLAIKSPRTRIIRWPSLDFFCTGHERWIGSLSQSEDSSHHHKLFNSKHILAFPFPRSNGMPFDLEYIYFRGSSGMPGHRMHQKIPES